MVVNCEKIWLEVSNYLDGDVEPDLRVAMQEHIRACNGCATVVEGTRNVVQLYGDERMLDVPLGFSQRLHQRLDESMPGHNLPVTTMPDRRGFLGWMVAAAASVLIVGSIEIVRSSPFRGTGLRSELARSGNDIPPAMMVLVAEDGKLFHVAGCPFIHDKASLRTMTAAEASRQGYTPCVRCMKKYLESA
jgi:hypothetical protein